ncbi:MAG: hypothetical protein WC608_03615 [Parcubacteria group bacterium]
MSKNTKLIIVVFSIILLVVAVYFFITLRSNPQKPLAQPQTPPQTQQPGSSPTSNFVVPPKDSGKMVITISQGSLEINNLYKNPVADLPGNGVAFKETNDYHMDFYPQDEGFIIAIQNPDIQTARDIAEVDFLQALGITKDQACSLKVTLGVPYNVNQQAAGQNYGLSFCPNGKSFNQ